MKCPKCGFDQADANLDCPACGVIFQKYLKIKRSTPVTNTNERFQEQISDETIGFIGYIKNLLVYVKSEDNPLIVWGRVLIYIVILIWGVKFILSPLEANYVGKSFWHLVNLPFHEAGHIFFRPFGRFLTSLGGSLGQLLMPLICMVVFLVKTRDTFAASFALWWLGENFIDLAPYIHDAKRLILPLIGGNTGRTSPYGFHDWEFILKEMGLIKYYHEIATAAQTIGIFLMILSFIWGGYILYKQLKIKKVKVSIYP